MWNSGGSPAQNAYFLTMNLFSSPTTFNGVRVYALDRASMLTGGTATRDRLYSQRRPMWALPIASSPRPRTAIRRLREGMKWSWLSIARLVAG